MTVAERLRKTMERRARKLAKEVWMREGILEEIKDGRKKFLVWNEDGLTIEVSDYEGKVHGRYKVLVSVKLKRMPTPKRSAAPPLA